MHAFQIWLRGAPCTPLSLISSLPATMATDRSLKYAPVPESTAPAEGFQRRGVHGLLLSDGYEQELQGWVSPLVVDTSDPHPWPSVARMVLLFVRIDHDALYGDVYVVEQDWIRWQESITALGGLHKILSTYWTGRPT